MTHAASAAMPAAGAAFIATIGTALATGAGTLLPWGLSFAAGAMLFVISHEIIPESHRDGRGTFASVGLFAGFVLMMLFDTMLV